MEATTRKQQLERLLEAAKGQPREIESRRVAGSGGRMRTVAICESGCWHGNSSQAMKCKEARYTVGRKALGE